MNRHSRRTVGRAVLVIACLAYFATITVIGQVSEGNPIPEPPARLHDARR